MPCTPLDNEFPKSASFATETPVVSFATEKQPFYILFIRKHQNELVSDLLKLTNKVTVCARVELAISAVTVRRDSRYTNRPYFISQLGFEPRSPLLTSRMLTITPLEQPKLARELTRISLSRLEQGKENMLVPTSLVVN